MKLQDKVALVTRGGRGIGKAVAMAYAREGAKVAICARNSSEIEQLRGKLLAGDPGDSNLDLIRKKILRRHSIDETAYRIDIIGSSPKRLEAFLQGRVAAAMLTPPASDKALAEGGVLLAKLAAHVWLDLA